MTKLTFINHASVLIEYEGSFLLTDPWFERPAFGSWLPTFPMFVHPAYLAAVGRMSLLISHGHDDHCDDDVLLLFDKNTPIISSDYASPSVSNRVRRLGFENYHVAPEEGVEIGPFVIRSFRNPDVSLDDAVYTIRSPDALVVHCNDNWNKLPDRISAEIKRDLAMVGSERAVLMSQTNSASGFPLNYRNFTRSEKRSLLREKVRKMFKVGMDNAAEVGVPRFLSYAGFASTFVKGHESYLEDSLFPTPSFLKAEFGADIPTGVELLDMYPGDTFDFESVHRSFLGRAYSDEAIKAASSAYYQLYGKVAQCDTYQEADAGQADPEAIKAFLTGFDSFVQSKVQRSDFLPTIFGKTLSIIIDDDERYTVKFGEGLISPSESNKEIFTTSAMMSRILDGRSLFENLYTGYNAEFKRNPSDEYNRDIMVYLVMYSYVHLASVRRPLAETPAVSS